LIYVTVLLRKVGEWYEEKKRGRDEIGDPTISRSNDIAKVPRWPWHTSYYLLGQSILLSNYVLIARVGWHAMLKGADLD
jgi:hypothetical protein